MQVKTIFTGNEKPVATHKMKSGGLGNVIAIRLLAGAELPRHTTPVPAQLILLEGAARYEELDSSNLMVDMLPGSFVNIPESLPHRLLAGPEGALLILAQ